MLLSCIVRNNYCTLPRNIRREKTLGEMWAAVIRTINNLLRTAWLWTQAPPNGDRARVSRCSEGDLEGQIREVPQEEQSPSMYIAQNVCIIIKRNFKLIASIAGKPTSEIYIDYVIDVYTYTYSYQQASSFILSHVQDMSYINRCLFFVG
jgi:hypothetical protein